MLPEEPRQEIDALKTELKAWCKGKYERQRYLAQKLGISERLLSNWIARRKTPSLQKCLTLQAFLKQRWPPSSSVSRAGSLNISWLRLVRGNQWQNMDVLPCSLGELLPYSSE
jgi:transcriptional regulator with XRE-family HTH domain